MKKTAPIEKKERDRVAYALLLVSSIIVGVVFFTGTAKAVTPSVYNTASTTQCLSNASMSCSSGSASAQGGYFQRIAFPLSSPNYESVSIHSIGLNYQTSDASTNSYVSLLNSNFIVLATTSPATTQNGWTDYFFPTPYTIDLSTEASSTPAYFKITYPTVRADRLYLSGDFNYGSPNYGVFSATNQGGFANVYQVTMDGFPASIPGVTATQQLSFRVNQGTAPTTILEFTSPENNTSPIPPFNFTGTCDTDFDFIGYKGASYASSTESIATTRVCSGNSFSFSSGMISQGMWTFYASSTGQSDGLVLYVLNRSELSDNTAQEIINSLENVWHCEIPYLGWDPCEAVYNVLKTIQSGFALLYGSVVNSIITTRPYSYPYEAYQAVQTASQTATGTIPIVTIKIPTTTAFINQPRMNFNPIPADLFTRFIPQASWDSIRLWGVIIMYIMFGFWFVKKFMNIR